MIKLKFLFITLFMLPIVCFTQSWKQIGITNPASVFEPNPGDLYPYGIGVVWDLKFEPGYNGKNNTRLFATGISSGLWLSPGGRGNDWTLLNTDFLPETSIGDFAIHPKNRNKIIIGTGLAKIRQSRNRDLFGLPKGKGIFRGVISKKNKISWHQVPGLYHEGEIIKTDSAFWNEKTKCIGRLCYTADASSMIMAVIEEETKTRYNSYIFKSDDNGNNWYLKGSYKNLFFHDLDMNPSDQKNMVASFSYDGIAPGHIYESTDGGETWNAIFSSSPELNEEGFFKTCYDNEIPARLWICKTTTYKNEIFIRTSDNKLNAYKNYRQWHNAGSCCAFAISTYNNNFFSAASVSLNCVYNDKFQNITPEMHSDIRCIAYYPGSRDMVVANDGGASLVIFDSVAKSYKVSDISIGLEIGRVTNISGSFANYGFANWDNSCRWVNSRQKLYKFMDLFGNESTVFEMNDSAFLDGSAGPTNASLYTFDSNLAVTQHEYYGGEFFTFIPHTRKFLYVNGTQLHRVDYSGQASIDNIIYTHPQGDKYFLQPRIFSSNPDIIYTATQQQGAYYHFQVFKSMDGGQTWKEHNTQPYGGSLSDIAINPVDHQKIAVGSVQGEVFLSDNSGLSFTDSRLPSEAGAVNTLTYINGHWILAACDHGLWILNEEGFSGEWIPFNDLLKRKAMKLPNCRITDLEYMPEAKIIRAATMGRGIFECDVKKLF